MSGKHPTETWWTEDQLALVENRRRVWHRMGFEPSDMLLIHRGPGQGSIGRQALPGDRPSADREIVKDGWDHAHCELCSATISTGGENLNEGYTDGKEWVCVDCFEEFIEPRMRGDV
jgi:hypothetical protein